LPPPVSRGIWPVAWRLARSRLPRHGPFLSLALEMAGDTICLATVPKDGGRHLATRRERRYGRHLIPASAAITIFAQVLSICPAPVRPAGRTLRRGDREGPTPACRPAAARDITLFEPCGFRAPALRRHLRRPVDRPDLGVLSGLQRVELGVVCVGRAGMA
jgi:hypothetical protein